MPDNESDVAAPESSSTPSQTSEPRTAQPPPAALDLDAPAAATHTLHSAAKV